MGSKLSTGTFGTQFSRYRLRTKFSAMALILGSCYKLTAAASRGAEPKLPSMEDLRSASTKSFDGAYEVLYDAKYAKALRDQARGARAPRESPVPRPPPTRRPSTIPGLPDVLCLYGKETEHATPKPKKGPIRKAPARAAPTAKGRKRHPSGAARRPKRPTAPTSSRRPRRGPPGSKRARRAPAHGPPPSKGAPAGSSSRSRTIQRRGPTRIPVSHSGDAPPSVITPIEIPPNAGLLEQGKQLRHLRELYENEGDDSPKTNIARVMAEAAKQLNSGAKGPQTKSFTGPANWPSPHEQYREQTPVEAQSSSNTQQIVDDDGFVWSP